ncbi:MAG: hypothetical protein RL748_825, partial [Pseudomonadota bacterium]
MAASNDNISMALFCDFENVALGVRDAKYDKFDIKPILERLLLKGSIVVKKAYCDWDRYKGFKAAMHEANFELIEIPHVRQSGKNSADIRLVVDALDLCYTKSHVNTFVIISGDSDFSPLVSKLRENAKQVIGVGVKQSTSDLLIANCDEFIFYDDLVRESRRAASVTAKAEVREDKPVAKRSSNDEERQRKEDLKTQAVEMAVATFEALVSERGDSGKMWASVLKQAIKRRKPDFNETYYGFRAFGNLLEEAEKRGLLELGRDEKSGMYASRASGAQAQVEVPAPVQASPAVEAVATSEQASAPVAQAVEMAVTAAAAGDAGLGAPATAEPAAPPQATRPERDNRRKPARPPRAPRVQRDAPPPSEARSALDKLFEVAPEVPADTADSSVIAEAVANVPVSEAAQPDALQETTASAVSETSQSGAATDEASSGADTGESNPRQAKTGREGRSRSPLGRRPKNGGSRNRTQEKPAGGEVMAAEAVAPAPTPEPTSAAAHSEAPGAAADNKPKATRSP